MEDEKRTVLKETEYVSGPTKHFKIGDPYYEDDQIGKLTTLKNMKSVNDKKTFISIREERVETKSNDKPLEYNEIVVTIACIKPEMINLYNRLKEGVYLGKRNDKKVIWLGCDTACFDVQTDRGSMTFDTGADGYYGSYKDYGSDGFMCDFGLDAGYVNYDRVLSDVQYLFPPEKERTRNEKGR